ncbi:hypothetical protein CBR_g37964 [Chara braunii]|uniref:Uncharacterized protein n=1 Tax=Chara braunii TaxID=69332 RepID=A0A388LPA5_CHABU|nr:hypothetical protein CBR_g37964 [Chara braunii]|eukprot:GBG84089.1 hypothetical protein CBR_g37964 [Chara braunii]
MEMASMGELQTGAAEWFSTVQASGTRLSQMVAMLRTTVIERSEPSMSWIRSVQQCMLEILWGLEEGTSPHLEAFIDRPRLHALMRSCHEELEEGQGLCSALEERFFEDEDDIVDGHHDNNAITDDPTKSARLSDDNDNHLICIAKICNNNNNNNNYKLTVSVGQAANINNNNYTVRNDGMGRGILRLCTLRRVNDYNNNNDNDNTAGGNKNDNNKGGGVDTGRVVIGLRSFFSLSPALPSCFPSCVLADCSGAGARGLDDWNAV